MFGALVLALTLQTSPTAVSTLQGQAKAMSSIMRSDLAKSWLAGAMNLTTPSGRTIYRGAAWLSQAQYDQLSPEDQGKAKKVPVTDELYYNTKYGSPIAYARAVDVAARYGLKKLDGSRVLDFGYGGIGQLRLFSLQGCEAVGVDVDPFLPALYSLPEDTGSFGKGTVKIVNGHFPGDASTLSEVGDGYTLMISKNTLKRGYIHPERPADKRQLIDLGVTDAAFLKAIHDTLKPGGLLLIYNLCPAPAPLDKPYIPWADGRSPFLKAQYEAAGLKVLAFDVKDDGEIRKVAHALGWDQGTQPMDTKKDLFAWYTVVRRE